MATDESPAALREVADRASRWQRLGVEFVIVSVKRQIPGASLAAMFNGARVVHGPADATLPQLRSLGLAAASGDVVVLVDSAPSADDAWIERLCTPNPGRTEGAGA